MKRHFRMLCFMLVAMAVVLSAQAASSVDPATPYAWGENIGWSNAYAGDYGLAMTPNIVSGYLWCENVGWVNLGDGAPDGGDQYSNASAADCGVNHDGAGSLSGYAWGENIGWLVFDTSATSGSQVTVSTDGAFAGYAWGENVGWINFGSGYGVQLVDSDEDGVPDAFETGTGVFVSAYDTGTLPGDEDSDDDGFDDGTEIGAGTDPNDEFDYPGALDPLHVTSADGGESWGCGTVQGISWECNQPLAVGGEVRLGLHKGATFIDWIVRRTDNDGWYDWVVWTDLDPDSTYTIRVQSYTDSLLKDFSDAPFSITELGVKNPNGAETWTMGDVYAIRWGSHDTLVGADVRIGLQYGATYFDWINRSTANDGAYYWKVPADLTSGYGYRIRVQSYSDNTVRDLSDAPFTLELPPLLWTSPELHDMLTMGSTYAVTWQCNDEPAVGPDVRIGLHKGGAFIDWMKRKTPNDETYNWTVPMGLDPAASYRLRVQSYTNSGLRNMSPAFTIAAP